jgi:NADP-dependent 3-hydroxy acid dehydrogenase YdfG/acyl carrier protein
MAQARIERMRERGCEVVVRLADVTVPAEVTRACAQARRGGVPLRGLVHAAGLLRDRALLSLTSQDLSEILAPKVAGAWHLHQATLDDPLDFFVLFSSAAAVLGSPGQGNYAGANAYLDALAQWRRAAGRVGTAIDWGPWGEIGMVAEPAARADRSTQLVRTLDAADGLDALEAAIVADVVGVAVLPYAVDSLVHLAPPTADVELFSELVGTDVGILRPAAPATASARPDLGHRYIPPRGPVETRIAEIWRRALGIDRIGAEDSLYELGGDSVLAGQVVTRINREYDVRVDLASAFADFTVRHLAHMVDEALVAKVAALSDPEAQRLLKSATTAAAGPHVDPSTGGAAQ